MKGRPRFDGRSDTAFLYFLLRGRSVVYVGVTAGDLRARVRDHRRGQTNSPPKDFDSVRYITVLLARAPTLEAKWIERLQPQYNREGREKPYRFCHKSRPGRAIVIRINSVN